jgi:hypothetical protein
MDNRNAALAPAQLDELHALGYELPLTRPALPEMLRQCKHCGEKGTSTVSLFLYYVLTLL